MPSSQTPLNDFQVDAKRCAVIVVDMQNDFGSPGGMFARGGIDISGIRCAIPPTALLIEAARKADIGIVYLKMGFRQDLSDAGAPGTPNRLMHERWGVGEEVVAPEGRSGRILVRDTWNTDILEELAPQPGDLVMYKHRFSGFFETELDDVLQQRGIMQLVFAGCTTSVCVESTVRDAMFRNYKCVVVEDCMSEPAGNHLARTNHDASIFIMRGFAVVCRSREMLTLLAPAPAPR